MTANHIMLFLTRDMIAKFSLCDISSPRVLSSSPVQCVSLRETLLQDPNPYQHVNYRNLPPLDAELLVAMAFSLIPHLPPGLMDEIARHPFLDEEKPGEGRE